MVLNDFIFEIFCAIAINCMVWYYPVPVTYTWKEELERKTQNAIDKALGQTPHRRLYSREFHKPQVADNFDQLDDDQASNKNISIHDFAHSNHIITQLVAWTFVSYSTNGLGANMSSLVELCIWHRYYNNNIIDICMLITRSCELDISHREGYCNEHVKDGCHRWNWG